MLKLYNFWDYTWAYPWNPRISDLSPSAGLQKLETLAICPGGADLSVLTALPNLSALSLTHAACDNFSFLSKMPSLVHLAITNTEIVGLRDSDLPSGLLSLVMYGEDTTPVLLENLPPLLECYCLWDQMSENFGAYALPYDYEWGPHRPPYR